MAVERWGSLSVDDHTDTAGLVANVLLYDRLVVPVMTTQPDRDEYAYWDAKGWNPDLQKKRLDDLEDLAIRRPWDAIRRARFRTRADELEAERYDTEVTDGHYKHLTRMILAQEAATDKPPGVDRVTVIAAYNSTASLERDFDVSDTDDHLTAQAYLLSRRLAVPDLPKLEDSLREAIKLSRDADFRAKRSELFDWQDLARGANWTPEETVERIAGMTDKYNAKVKEAVSEVRWKFAFMICGIGLGFVTGGPIGAAATATLSLLQFAKFDRKPAIVAGSSQPAAMFHDVERRLGLRLVGA